MTGSNKQIINRSHYCPKFRVTYAAQVLNEKISQFELKICCTYTIQIFKRKICTVIVSGGFGLLGLKVVIKLKVFFFLENGIIEDARTPLLVRVLEGKRVI